MKIENTDHSRLKSNIVSHTHILLSTELKCIIIKAIVEMIVSNFSLSFMLCSCEYEGAVHKFMIPLHQSSWFPFGTTICTFLPSTTFHSMNGTYNSYCNKNFELETVTGKTS